MEWILPKFIAIHFIRAISPSRQIF